MATIFWLSMYGAHWCHLANMTEPSMCSSDVALCQITLTTCYNHYCIVHCVSKNVPPLTCYNLDVHDLIVILCGRSVTEKVRNQMMLCFPTSF